MVFQTEVIIIGCTKNSIAIRAFQEDPSLFPLLYIRAFQEDPSLFPLFTDLLLAIALFLLLLILLAGCDK